MITRMRLCVLLLTGLSLGADWPRELPAPIWLSRDSVPATAAIAEFQRASGGLTGRILAITTEAKLPDGLPPIHATITLTDRTIAESPETLKLVGTATGILITGDRTSLTKSLVGTALETALWKRFGDDIPMMITGEAITLAKIPGVTITPTALPPIAGQVTIQIPKSATLRIRGRDLKSLGTGEITLGFAAGNRRPTSRETLKAGVNTDLFALMRTARDRAAKQPVIADQPADPIVKNGSLIIGGGGGLSDEVVKRFIELAGGPDASIIVIPTALEDPIPPTIGEVRLLRKCGAKNVTMLHTRDRTEADTEKFAAPLAKAGGVWFSGGRQWRFVDAYEGTRTATAISDVLTRGGVIGGSSAGASIQTEYMPRGHPLGNFVMMAEGYERGFGYLPGVAVDQHFFARKRTADMTGLIKMYPQLIGIGIDEGTGIEVKGSIATVYGKSKVAFYDPRKPIMKDDTDYIELRAGERYDLMKRSVSP